MPEKRRRKRASKAAKPAVSLALARQAALQAAKPKLQLKQSVKQPQLAAKLPTLQSHNAIHDVVMKGVEFMKHKHPKATAVVEKVVHLHARQKQADNMAGDANNQGKYYTASLMFPAQLPGAKVPDIKTYRTLATQSVTHAVIPSVLQATDNAYYSYVLVCPFTQNLITYGTSFSSGGAYTATNAINDSIQTFASSNWISKRLVSLEVIVRNTTSAFSMQGRWGIMRMPFGTGPNNTFATFESFDKCSVGNFEPNGKTEKVRCVWLPAGTSDLSFTSTTTGAVSDNTIIAFQCVSTTAQIIEVDVTANWEAKVLVASEEGLSPTTTMGSEATAAESLSIAAMHPSLGSAAVKGEKSIWDAINAIAPKAMSMIPIVGEAFSWLGGAVASLFGTHTDRCLAFAQSLQDEHLDEVKANVEKGYLPKEFLVALATMRDMHVSICDTAVRYCVPDEKHETIIVRVFSGVRDEFGEKPGGFRVLRSPDQGCPNCPPEYCTPNTDFEELKEKVEELSALVEEEVKTARRGERTDDFERVSQTSVRPEYIGHPSTHRGYLKGGAGNDVQGTDDSLVPFTPEVPPFDEAIYRRLRDDEESRLSLVDCDYRYTYEKNTLASVEAYHDMENGYTRVVVQWKDGHSRVRYHSAPDDVHLCMSRREKELWGGIVHISGNVPNMTTWRGTALKWCFHTGYPLPVGWDWVAYRHDSQPSLLTVSVRGDAPS